MKEFRNRVAVVTGAASGIGFAMCRRLAAEGVRIVLADVEEGALEVATDAIRATGVDAIGVRTDVTDPAQVAALGAAATAAFGNIHILANNAGVAMKGLAWELSVADWRWVLDVCLLGVVHGVTEIVPGMVAHGEEAHIINTASMNGIVTAPTGGPYQAAKHGITALTESLFFDLRQAAPQVKVTLLCPGYTDTHIRTSSRNRSDRYGTPTSVGRPAAAPPGAAAAAGPERHAPDTVAELAFGAIRDERFYAIADPDIWLPLFRTRFDAILALADPVPVQLTG